MAGEDRRYLAWIRTQPCCSCSPGYVDGLGVCGGPVEAHHKTGAGMGLRAHDHETMPLCAKHHKQLHEFTGMFEHDSRMSRLAWQERRIAEHQKRYSLSESGVAGEVSSSSSDQGSDEEPF